MIYYSLNKLDMAVYYYRKAEQIRVRLSNIITPVDLAVTYKGLCDSFDKMADQANKTRQKLIFYKIALVNLNKGLNIRKEEIKKGNQRLNIDEILKTKQNLEDKIEYLH